MSKVAVLIADLFEDMEYTQPAAALKKAGHDLVHVGLKAHQTVKGKSQGTPVTIDRAVQDARMDDFDALLIPGGYSPDKLRADDDAAALAGDFVRKGKPVFAICHGPQLLITADVLRGRTVTGWKSIVQDLKNAGTRFLDEVVVEDGNLVTSRHPSDIPAFIRKMLSKLDQ